MMVVPFASKKSELDTLLEKVHKFTTRAERAVIKKAYFFSQEAHKFQLRKSGDPYFIHPVQVSFILADLQLDYQCICAGLMHDIIEDTDIEKVFLEQEFGIEISSLVDAVTKLSAIKSSNSELSKVNNIRKMILATVKDGRVILIKLADRLHNMRTLTFLPESKMRRIAQETLDIYAPLAGRFGVYKIKWELEDLCLYYLDQNAYQQIKETVSEKRSARELRLEKILLAVRQKLKNEKIKAVVEGRPKHFYSIYEKMKSQNKALKEIYDLTGIRILLDSVQGCYTTLGIIHNIWLPVPGRFKDYISVPKSNGYQSLHTTVVGEDGKHVEFQIRTRSMHVVAEVGIAAHWAYKENKRKDANQENPMEEAYRMLDNIASMETGEENASEFMEELKENLTSREVYVFTPRGDIIALPRESTVLDLAFRIHTDLGLKCAGGKIEGRLVSIRTQLKSGDQVQIITNSATKPSTNWLNFLKTPHARNKLKAWLRKKSTSEIELDKNKSKEEKEQIFEKHKNLILKNSKHRKKKSLEKSPMVLWHGESNFASHYAQCCTPQLGDVIYGFITKMNGISVHKKNCNSLKSLMNNPATRDRVVMLDWSGYDQTFHATLTVEGTDRPRMLLNMVNSISTAGSEIIKMEASSLPNGEFKNVFTIEADSHAHLQTVIDSLKAIEGIKVVTQTDDQVFSKKKKA